MPADRLPLAGRDPHATRPPERVGRLGGPLLHSGAPWGGLRAAASPFVR